MMHALQLTLRICICLMLFAATPAGVLSNRLYRPAARLSAAPLVLTWTGAYNSSWMEARNWSPQQVPTVLVDCRIPEDLSSYPEVTGSTAACGSLSVTSGAALSISQGARLSVARADISGVLHLAPLSKVSAAKEINIRPDGSIARQPGEGRVEILFREADGKLAVEGTLSVGGPLQISGANGTGRLSVSPGGLVQIQDGGLLGVAGSVVNNGAMQQSQVVGMEDISRFLHITSDGSKSGVAKYDGVDIFPFFKTLGMTTVTVWGNQPCPQPLWSRSSVQRCYLITPTQEEGATVWFYYRHIESNLQKNPVPYLEDGTAWVPQLGAYPEGSGDAMSVRLSGQIRYGTFALYDPTSPVIWTYFPGVYR